MRTVLEVGDEETVILATSGRSLMINLLHLGGIIAAAEHHPLQGKSLHLIFSPHPGDENDPITYVELAADRTKQPGMAMSILISPRHLQNRITGARWKELLSHDSICRGLCSGSEAIPGADILVVSASTLGQEAAAQRIPVVDYFTTPALARLKYGSPLNHEDCALGISEAADVDSPKDLAEVMALLLDPASPTRQRQLANQKEHYPLPTERGKSLRIMTETLIRHGYSS